MEEERLNAYKILRAAAEKVVNSLRLQEPPTTDTGGGKPQMGCTAKEETDDMCRLWILADSW